MWEGKVLRVQVEIIQQELFKVIEMRTFQEIKNLKFISKIRIVVCK